MEDIHLRTSGRASLSVSVTRTPETGLMCTQIDGFLLFVFSLIKLIGMNGNGDVFSTYQKFSLLVSWKTFAVCSSNSSWLKMGYLIITLLMGVTVFPHMCLLMSLEIKSMFHPLIWKKPFVKRVPIEQMMKWMSRQRETSSRWWAEGWQKWQRTRVCPWFEPQGLYDSPELIYPNRLNRNAELWWS